MLRRWAVKLLPKFARETVQLLERPLPPEDREDVLAACRDFEAALGTRPSPVRIGPDTLARERLAASKSGGTPSAVRGFAAGSALVLDWVAQGQPVTVLTLRTLNAALRELDGPTPLRREPTTLDGDACPAPSILVPLLERMFPAVMARSREVHAVVGGALLHQWVVTVHPFDDANGRTARLALDHHLGLAALPPAIIGASAAEHVAVRPDNAAWVTPRFACEVVLRGLQTTLAIAAREST